MRCSKDNAVIHRAHIDRPRTGLFNTKKMKFADGTAEDCTKLKVKCKLCMIQTIENGFKFFSLAAQMCFSYMHFRATLS